MSVLDDVTRDRVWRAIERDYGPAIGRAVMSCEGCRALSEALLRARRRARIYYRLFGLTFLVAIAAGLLGCFSDQDDRPPQDAPTDTATSTGTTEGAISTSASTAPSSSSTTTGGDDSGSSSPDVAGCLEPCEASSDCGEGQACFGTCLAAECQGCFDAGGTCFQDDLACTFERCG